MAKCRWEIFFYLLPSDEFISKFPMWLQMFRWPAEGGADPGSPGLVRHGQLCPFALSSPHHLRWGKKRTRTFRGDCVAAGSLQVTEGPRGTQAGRKMVDPEWAEVQKRREGRPGAEAGLR